MNAFLDPRNGTSLTSIVGGAAHSISLFQENEQRKNINTILILQSSISISEPIGVQIDEIGHIFSTRYHVIGITNDEKAPALESILHYMGENFF